jgi:hypothetical protein
MSGKRKVGGFILYTICYTTLHAELNICMSVCTHYLCMCYLLYASARKLGQLGITSRLRRAAHTTGNVRRELCVVIVADGRIHNVQISAVQNTALTVCFRKMTDGPTKCAPERSRNIMPPFAQLLNMDRIPLHYGRKEVY